MHGSGVRGCPGCDSCGGALGKGWGVDMMILRDKHTGDGNGFTLVLESGEHVHACNMSEVKIGIDHHMGGGTFYGKSHYLIDNPRCPVCRRCMEKRRKK